MGVLRAVGNLLRLMVMAALVALVILVGLLYFDMNGQVTRDVRQAAASALGTEVVQSVERSGETAVSALDRIAQPIMRLAETALAAVSGEETAAETSPRTPNAWAEAESRAVLAEINAYRRENGLKPLTWDDNLAAFGQQRSDDMIAREYFSHNDPRTGRVVLTELRRLVTVGENLYQVSGPAVQFMRQVSASTVRGWKNSPSHNELMLMDSMRYGGVAIARTPTRIVAVLIVSG